MDLGTLPTNVVELIAFLTVAYLGGMGWMVRYFLNAQRTQTRTYMDYIQNKNGNLERVTKNFTDAMNDSSKRFEQLLTDQGERHKQIIDDYAARLESALHIKVRAKRRTT